MKKYFNQLLLFTLVFIFWGCSSSVEVVILHTNDHHGYCWSIDGKGGLAKQMTVIKELRKKHPNLLLLSAGDINTGATESDINHAEPSFKGMNLLGFHAMAVGNHEFDNALSQLRVQEEWSDFIFLSANIYDKNTNQRMFAPYIIKTVDGIRVGILGLTTEETQFVANMKYIKDLEFRDPVLEAKKLIPELKQKSDIIIAVTHMGYYPEGPDPSHGKGDIILASENPEIAVIVGGHSHTLLPQPVKVRNTVLVQAYQYAKNLGDLRLKIDRKSFQVKKYTYEMHDLNEKVVEDPEMVSFLDPYLQKAKIFFDEKVGESKVDLIGERELVRSQETNLGNLITDVFREVTKADIALQNGGGIRASIGKGKISFGDIKRAFPFNNTIVLTQLTGKEVLELLNRSASLPRPAGGFLHVSGLSFVIDKNQAKNVKVGRKPLQLDKTYRVATNDFTANGGDGYELLKNKTRTDTGFVLSTALKNYLLARKVISPKIEGRIRIQ
ncbi:MAG: 5'-nucleotidase C-terminal domain-containing protein [Deltaproteobacteria bacterium]|nr:5'-nucleotidase C-terminal domain-containing protein [Deltaproteobacteria bacterium]